MGEAKQRRRRSELGANVSLIDDPREAMARLYCPGTSRIRVDCAQECRFFSRC
jgi:hypothetical protein